MQTQQQGRNSDGTFNEQVAPVVGITASRIAVDLSGNFVANNGAFDAPNTKGE